MQCHGCGNVHGPPMCQMPWMQQQQAQHQQAMMAQHQRMHQHHHAQYPQPPRGYPQHPAMPQQQQLRPPHPQGAPHLMQPQQHHIQHPQALPPQSMPHQATPQQQQQHQQHAMQIQQAQRLQQLQQQQQHLQRQQMQMQHQHRHVHQHQHMHQHQHHQMHQQHMHQQTQQHQHMHHQHIHQHQHMQQQVPQQFMQGGYPQGMPGGQGIGRAGGNSPSMDGGRKPGDVSATAAPFIPQHMQQPQHPMATDARQPQQPVQPLPDTPGAGPRQDPPAAKSLDANAPVFIPAQHRDTPPTRSSPPPQQPAEPTAEQRALCERELSGTIASWVSETATLECAEIKAAFGIERIPISPGQDFRLMVAGKPRVGQRVVFHFTAEKRAATRVDFTAEEKEAIAKEAKAAAMPTAMERFMGVIIEWTGDSGKVASTDLGRYGLGETLNVRRATTANGAAALETGSRVTFRVKEEDGVHLAVDVLPLPKSLEELGDSVMSANFSTPNVAPPKDGQNPWQLDIIFYHAACWDGLCACYAFFNAAGPDQQNVITYIPITTNFEDPIPDVRGKNVAVVDVTFPRETMNKVAQDAKNIIIIDHHASTAGDLLDNEHIDPENVRFDLHHSAAALAWEYCRLAVASETAPSYIKDSVTHKEIPPFLSLVGEIDLGRFGHEFPVSRRWAIGVELFAGHSRFDDYQTFGLPRVERHGALPQTLSIMKRFDKLILAGDIVVQNILAIGQEAEVELEEQVEEWMSQASIRRFKLKPDLKVAIVNLNVCQAKSPKERGRLVPYKFARNELGHRLARVPGVFCGAVVSGRSIMLRADSRDGFNVGDLCKLHGGGGHATAAAFQPEEGYDPFDGEDEPIPTAA